MHDLRDLRGALASHAGPPSFRIFITSDRANLLQQLIRSVAHWWPELEDATHPRSWRLQPAERLPP